MRIACNRCQTHYEIPEDRLAGGAVKVRCSDCGHTFVVRRRAGPEAAPKQSPAETPFGEVDFKDFDAPADSAPSEPEAERPAAQEARFEDFDFHRFEETAEEPAPPTPAAPDSEWGLADETGAAGEEEDLPALGELDLGDLEELEREFGTGREEDDEELGAEEIEPLERVTEEELVAPRPQGVQVQGVAEEMPHLDIQRGPRRSEGVKPSPLVARDRRRSPLFWIVVVAAVVVAAFTAFNVVNDPERAFEFLNPAKIRSLWRMRTMEAHFAVADLRGYYRDLPAGRKAFVIRGDVVNKSEGPRSLIRVRGNLFGPDGKTVGTKDVFCGNVLTEQELASLPEETVEARLQNEVGQTLSNVDIAPGAKVPFMLVFPSPPEGVEKFNVAVTEARAGSSP